MTHNTLLAKVENSLRGGFPEVEPTARALPRVCRIREIFSVLPLLFFTRPFFLFASIIWGTGVFGFFA